MVKTNALTLVSSDLTINGNIESAGEIQIDGTTDGDIRCQKLVIGASAVVRGKITADTVVIAGRFNGRIEARDVVFSQSARVFANILQEQLTIEQGAFFEGNCKAISGALRGGTASTFQTMLASITAESATASTSLTTPRDLASLRAAD